MVCSSSDTPGSKSSAIKQPSGVLTSTPIPMSAVAMSRLPAISTAISSSVNPSQTTVAKSVTSTATTHVRNLMFSPPDKVF